MASGAPEHGASPSVQGTAVGKRVGLVKSTSNGALLLGNANAGGAQWGAEQAECEVLSPLQQHRGGGVKRVTSLGCRRVSVGRAGEWPRVRMSGGELGRRW